MITVVHPKDRSTVVLKVLYEGLETNLLDESMTNREIRHGLHHADIFESLMILGHGADNGLLSRVDDTQKEFDRNLVGKHHLFYLRKQHRLIGIWCYAHLFAQTHRLTGLFTGMFISEMSEAEKNGVRTTEEEIQTELVKFVKRLRQLLDTNMHLSEIVKRLKNMDDAHTPLTEFNYHSIYYINQGIIES